MDGPGHLLSLKVMRVSRPSLASAWQPFYSSSPAFSAHSTASILSLQGSTPLTGHPKTLRDLTNASELLTLPASFGSIQLGETFSSCLCVNNEAQVEIDAVTMKVEMQTVTSKVLLADFGGTDYRLAPGDTLESLVHHEIKELGQHVLACTVSYKVPSSSRSNLSEENAMLQTFRKFYKFAVTNPLSVKTKVHPPRSPSALLSVSEREKVFLEVHIQNLTQEPIWFERMLFECVDDWSVQDINLGSDSVGDIESTFSESAAILHPQDMRQYIYILSPKTQNSEPTLYTPGSIISLGRLDLSWRSGHGEPGRLLTSMLSRKIPLPPPVQSASAVPPHLKKGPPSRPPSRSGSPTPSLRKRSSSIAAPRPQSPTPAVALPSQNSAISNMNVSLIVREFPRDSLPLDKPFSIPFTIVVSWRPHASDGPTHSRVVSLVVQHIQPSRGPILPSNSHTNLDMLSPRLTSPGFSTPSPSSGTFNYALAHQKLMVASPRQHIHDEPEEIEAPTPKSMASEGGLMLPPPFYEPGQPNSSVKVTNPPGVQYYGSSAHVLPTMTLTPQAVPDTDEGGESAKLPKLLASQDFELDYISVDRGFTTVRGLRVLLLTDNDKDSHFDNERKPSYHVAHVLKQWDVVAEVQVTTSS